MMMALESVFSLFLFAYYFLRLLQIANPFINVRLFLQGLVSWIIIAIIAYWLHRVSGLFLLQGDYSFLPTMAVIFGLSITNQGLGFQLLQGHQKQSAYAHLSAFIMLLAAVLYFVFEVNKWVALVLAFLALPLSFAVQISQVANLDRPRRVLSIFTWMLFPLILLYMIWQNNS